MKTYWQSVDIDGTVKTWLEASPTLHIEKYYDSCGDFIEEGLFPIPLKPLQIAKITVNENGTWSYEIEREEGWYMARHDEGAHYVLLYKNGDFWISLDLNMAYSGDQINHYTISSTRIPDECII
mgnify:CR=1 FL=1